MPYEIRKQGDKYCVYKKDTGESTGCSDTRAMAVKHMRAMYANEKSKAVGAKDYKPDASWLNSYIYSLNNLVENAQYSFQYDETEHAELIAFSERLIDDASGYLEQLISWRNQWYGSPEDFKEAGILDKVKALLGVTGKSVNLPSVDVGARHGQVVLTKEASGRTRVLLRVSNIFKDRHGEIITEAAHKEYEAYVSESGQYPEFWLWHTPGSRWGQADLVSYDDGFLTMSGLVDTGKEYIAEALATQGDSIGVSHGFKYLKLGEDSIDWYRTFEASPLPVSEAANVWTGMMLAEKEWSMGLADKHKKFFEALHVPASVVAEWDQSSKSLGQLLKEAGVEYKDLATEPDPPDPPAPDPQPDPVPQVSGDSGPAILEALNKLNSRFDGLESKQKELEEKVKDSVASTMAAAVIPGASGGFVASKQGEAPSDTERVANKEWEQDLVAFITGGGK